MKVLNPKANVCSRLPDFGSVEMTTVNFVDIKISSSLQEMWKSKLSKNVTFSLSSD